MYVHPMANEILTHAQKRLANLQGLRILGSCFLSTVSSYLPLKTSIFVINKK